jgi:hypothetical protein
VSSQGAPCRRVLGRGRRSGDLICAAAAAAAAQEDRRKNPQRRCMSILPVALVLGQHGPVVLGAGSFVVMVVLARQHRPGWGHFWGQVHSAKVRNLAILRLCTSCPALRGCSKGVHLSCNIFATLFGFSVSGCGRTFGRLRRTKTWG